MDYINKACFFASRLGLHDLPAQQLLANGNAAWSNVQVSEQLIPTARVCNRIQTTTAPSVADVEHALDKMTALAVAPAVAVTGAPTGSVGTDAAATAADARPPSDAGTGGAVEAASHAITDGEGLAAGGAGAPQVVSGGSVSSQGGFF